MNQKPVYSLKVGDKFIGTDNQVWTVDELKEPSSWRSNLEIGASVGVFTIFASRGQSNRRFYHAGSKLITLKDK